ncbi:hypothetical protein OPS25_03265 [Alteromonas ponticola]|uniref:HDOD domain-containing protein n=1 Tax=Alteromonas aquimaris TaxID=2998417 RepID=A0ABT3P447_9ALTE|nr:hypothetical protein [Alteromonas aquimaris]MCW8107523.1 hypothetical protein [Alteromonas aquimaris]
MFDFDEQPLLCAYEQLFESQQEYCSKTFVNRCLAVAKQCLEASRQQPQLVLALLSSKLLESSPSPVCLRGALFLSITTRRDKFNEHFAQHLIASFICTFVIMHARENYDTKPELKSLVRYFQSLGLSIWKETIRIARLLTRRQAFRHLSSARLSYRQQYLLSACVVARHLPHKEMLSIFRLLTHAASPNLLDTIRNWAQFPGVWLPGRVVNIDNDTAVILVREKHKIAYLPLPANTKADTLKWARSDGISLLKCPQSVEFKKFKKWSENLGLQAKTTMWPFTPSFALNRPPSKLLTIIDLLKGTETDITLLCEHIKQEPLLAQFLTASASNDNRMKLPVHDVKQAVLTYGMERVGDMLIQQALYQRLTQKKFPISSLCQRLLFLTSTLAALISYETDANITPQRASLLVTFAIAPIFSITGLKIALNWRPAATHLYNPDSLAPAAERSIRQQSVQLLSGWHQSSSLLAAVNESNRLPDQCHQRIRQAVSILGLSLSLARQWLWNTPHYCELTHEFDTQAKKELGIDDGLLLTIQHQLGHHIWLPLNQS